MTSSSTPYCLLIFNIPTTFHSSDLRSFFSDFIETDKFSCFHFRHRPQSELLSLSDSEKSPSSARQALDVKKFMEEKALCCLVSLPDEITRTQMIKKYSFQHWVDGKDKILTSRCIITSVKVIQSNEDLPVPSLSILPKRMEIEISSKKHESLFELKPPVLMPKGNVGTPTKHFLALINSCQLPSKLIGKLGLHFPKTKTRKYGSVPFNYGTKIDKEHKETKEWVEKTPFIEQSSSATTENSDVQDLEEEEWDRHEALHDDVTEQERSKERLYEEEMEVVWEKGGPGIVWYTDAQLWREAEGDFDEQTTDDWDVDYSVYFEENGGDMDARDALEMRKSTMKRQGDLTESVFKKPKNTQTSRHKPSFPGKSGMVGPFELHTRGIGRRLMERTGWRDGSGLGPKQKGIAKPIESEGQQPKERKGLGYFGEQLPRFSSSSQRRTAAQGALIATVYDKPSDTDPVEPLLRRNQPTCLKYRYSESNK